ncbi:MAG: hypothetical protein P1V20_03130 [Verrucomicrobiales bacterium]|nr:hypothetical protein [Verrucomicrobiales bacterium]
MKDKIDKLKTSMESTGRDHSEIVAALERLDARIREDEQYPGRVLIGDEIESTAVDLDNEELMDGHLSGRWKTLGERLEEWEKDHPGVTLMIGDIARALAVSGL